MNRLFGASVRVAREVSEELGRVARAQRRITPESVRLASHRAAQGTQWLGREATGIARGAVVGAVHAATEISGEASSFVKDAVIGVVEGSGQVISVTAPVVKEVVAGAIHGSGKVAEDVGDVSREAVEGAIVGAASVGMETRDAASAAVEGAVEAVVDTGGDMRVAAEAALGGVVSAVASTGGDVTTAARHSAYALVAHDAASRQHPSDVAEIAANAVDAALGEAEESEVDDVIAAAAAGAVEAAYAVSQSHGDAVRLSILQRLREPRSFVSPATARQISDVGERLSNELPRGKAAWRGLAMYRAARILIEVGAIDLAASLAYFTLFSFLPAIALTVMVAAFFWDPQAVGEWISDILLHYFPASGSLISEAVDNLTSGSLALGVVAIIGIVLGANGLFLAANRSLNRVFGSQPRRAIDLTVTQIVVSTLIAAGLLLSVGLSALLQVVLNLGYDSLGSVSGGSSWALILVGAVSAVLPVVLTAVIFALVYQTVPNVDVEWRDATYGAIIAIVLFETGKHLFLLVTNLSGQRYAVYGPAASVVLLLSWGFVANLIFLYGAALAKAAADLRPARGLHKWQGGQPETGE